jgi:hypothetical protein
MAVKAEQASQALTPFTCAVQRAVKAAEESADAGRQARARVRRQRIISQTFGGVVVPPTPPIDMPDDWAEDEPTLRFELPRREACGA